MNNLNIFDKSNWKTYQLGQICSIRSGKTPSTKKKEYWEDGTIPWLTQTEISAQTLTPKRFITENAVKECVLPLTTKNSVLLCNISEAVAFYAGISSLSCNQQVFLLEPTIDKIEPNYLYYLLCAEKNKLNFFMRGTIFKSLTKTELEKFSVPLPPLSQQKQILTKFQLVYNKIHKTEVVYNDTLLKILQKHLEIGDLLFLKYQDSQIKVGEKFRLVRGKAFNIRYRDGTVKWVNSGDLTDCYFLTKKTKTSKLITIEDLENYKLQFVRKNSLLIADREFNSQKIVWSQTDDCLVGANAVNLFNDNQTENATLLFSFRQINWNTYQTGSIIKQLPIKILETISFIWVSNPTIQARFLTLLNSPLAKIKDLHSQIKDLLLLKYFSGKKLK